MDTSKQEALWVLRAQCGDRAALEQLLEIVQPPLRRYLRGLIGATDADDVLQEVLVLAFRKLQWLERPELVRPWLFRIASRVAFRHLKREKRWLERKDDTLLDSFPAREKEPADGLLDRLENIGDLSPASRAVLVLHFREEMSLPDVAAVLEIPLGTVKSRLAYGLNALRKQYGKRRSF